MKIIPSQTLNLHSVMGCTLHPPFPTDTKQAVFALGCFWGAEHCFWQQNDVCLTAVGYAGGTVAEPSYQEVCSGNSGHAESVLVVYEDNQNTYEKLLKVFWQAHDPTQGMRQGNDIGSQYRSVIFCFDEHQYRTALGSRTAYQKRLSRAGYGRITTEITRSGNFYYAEDYHQQYLAKNPRGYSG